MSLTDCEINPNWNCSTNCVIFSTAVANESVTFSILDTKLYVSVVTLSTQDNIKLLQQLKRGFKKQLTGINTNRKYQQKDKKIIINII